MRNLNLELKEFGLDWAQRECVLQWVNTLTNQDLFDNGSQNACFVAGDVDYCDPSEINLTFEQRIQKWIDDNIEKYRPDGLKINFMKDLKYQFELPLTTCKSLLDKNW